jgi:hypothetical protein
MSNTNHTPTPKYILDRARGWTYVCESNRRITIGMAWDEAEQIRNKLNAHDELVAALTEMETLLEMCAAGEAPSPESEEYYTQRITQVRAALAKVQS